MEGVYAMIHHVPLSEYLSWPEYCSGDIKAMRQGPPAMVPFRRSAPRTETDATRVGSAAHCAILEESRFASTYAHKPDGMSFATKEGKDWRAQHGGQVILTHEEWCVVERIARVFAAKRAAFDSLRNASGVEVSITIGDRKARPDWYDSEYVTDLKASRLASLDPFRAYAAGWFHQLAWYRTLLREEGFPVVTGRLVMISTEEPHHVYLVEVKEAALDLCELENENALAKIRECASTGVWPGTPDEWTLVDLPASAMMNLVGAMEVDDG